MEQINRIELRGKVGNVYYNSNGESSKVRFGLVTNHAYKKKKGESVVETLWINVNAWEGKSMPDLRLIEKGQIVHVCGRLRGDKYTSAEGIEKESYEVIARSIRIENETEASAQMDL